jgi:hypothetical protein
MGAIGHFDVEIGQMDRDRSRRAVFRFGFDAGRGLVVQQESEGRFVVDEEIHRDALVRGELAADHQPTVDDLDRDARGLRFFGERARRTHQDRGEQECIANGV